MHRVARLGAGLLFVTAFASAPAGADVKTLCGDSKFSESQLDAALAACTRYIESGLQGSDLVVALSDRARVYLLVKKNYDSAIIDASEAIRVALSSGSQGSPYSVAGWAYYLRGRAFFSKANYDPAIVDFTRAIELASGSGINEMTRQFARVYRAESYSMEGNEASALADYAETIRQTPYSILALHSRGLFFEKNEKLDEALADFRSGLAAAPNLHELNPKLEEEIKGDIARVEQRRAIDARRLSSSPQADKPNR